MVATTIRPLTWFKVNPQVRKRFDEAELRQLGESMKAHGQLQPVLAQSDGTLIAGERRYRAAKLVGLESLEVKIADAERDLTESEIKIWQLTENMQRADLTGFEKWQGCEQLMKLNPGWQQKELAKHLNLDPSMVTRLLSPSKCVNWVREALEAGRIGISDCYEISKLPEKEQGDLLTAKLEGASRDTIAQAGRKSRNRNTPAVRVSFVKVPLSSGATVKISGENISLDDAIEAGQEAVKAMKKAREDGLDSKTAQAVFKDKAKKG